MFALQRISSYATVLVVFCSLFFSSNQVLAQAPEGINYQAVARDNAGDPLSNQIISVRFSVIATSTSGTVLYQEDHSTISTNQFGLFNLVIGQGSRTGGSLTNFASIDWSLDSKFLRVEVDAGSGFENLGTTQMLSVPYALYAKTSGTASNAPKAGNGIILRNDTIINDGDLSETNELITALSLLSGNILRITEASIDYDIDLTPLLSTISDDQNLSFSANGDSILIEDGDGISIQFITDTIDNFRNRISNNASAIVLNRLAISDTAQNISLAIADTASILRALISNGSDDQNLSFSTNGDSILIEDGNGINIKFILDTIANYDTRIAANKTASETNATDIITNQNTIAGNTQAIVDSTTNTRALLADSSTTLRALIGTDNDADSTNELIDSMRFVNRTLEIYQQGNAITISFDTLNNSRRLNLFNRTIANRDSIDAVVNIINTIVTNDQDTDSTNEIQQLSLASDQLSIDDPSGTVSQTPIDLSIYNTPEDSTRIANGTSLIFIPTANDSISFVTGGTEALRIDNTGRSYFKQPVGINTPTPSAQLEVFSDNQGLAQQIFAVGRDTPPIGLEVEVDGGTTNITAQGVIATAYGSGKSIGMRSFSSTTHPTDSSIALFAKADGNQNAFAGFFERGNVYIADTLVLPTGAALGSVLTSSANGMATWESAARFGNVFTAGTNTAGRIAYWNSSDSITFYDDLFIDELNNRVGIGTTAPTQKLQVNGAIRVSSGFNANNGTSGSPSFRFENDANTGMFLAASDQLAFTTGGVEAARIDASGNIGIRTSTPSYVLDVEGTFSANSINVNNEYTLPDSAGTLGQVLQADAAGNPTWEALPAADTLNIIADTDRNTSIDIDGSDIIHFTQNGTEFFRMDSSRLEFLNTGNLFIGTNAGANTTNIANHAIGENALRFNTSGLDNVAYGRWALRTNTTGSSNVAVGNYAMEDNLTGNQNVSFGHRAGGEVNGSSNTFIGNAAGYNATPKSIDGSVFLGNLAGSLETNSNRLYIENSNSITPLIYGNFASDSVKIFGTLGVGNEYAFPDSAGTFGQVLQANATGNPIWQNAVNFGSGALGQLTYFTANDSLRSSSELFWEETNARLRIGSNASTSKLTITGNDTNTVTIRNTITGAAVGTITSGLFLQNTGSNGTNYGINVNTVGGSSENRGLNATAAGGNFAYGITAAATGNAGTTVAYGGNIQSFSTGGDAFGVRATGRSTTANSYGIRGDATGSGSINYGVYGNASSATTNYAGYFNQGDVFIRDTLILNNTFRISNGAAAGNILISDANGNAAWTTMAAATTCPTGMTNVTGNICIDTDERAASDWYDASQTCTSLGYKLPSWAEWYGATSNAILTNETNNWEWVSDGTSNTARKVGNTNLKNSANDDPELGSANFRCIFYK